MHNRNITTHIYTCIVIWLWHNIDWFLFSEFHLSTRCLPCLCSPCNCHDTNVTCLLSKELGYHFMNCWYLPGINACVLRTFLEMLILTLWSMIYSLTGFCFQLCIYRTAAMPALFVFPLRLPRYQSDMFANWIKWLPSCELLVPTWHYIHAWWERCIELNYLLLIYCLNIYYRTNVKYLLQKSISFCQESFSLG